jgi:hypothetical protein
MNGRILEFGDDVTVEALIDPGGFASVMVLLLRIIGADLLDKELNPLF